MYVYVALRIVAFAPFFIVVTFFACNENRKRKKKKKYKQRATAS